jgi:dienelactone hydrolase
MMAQRVRNLLAARRFLSPQLVGDRIYFISDLSGRLSLWAMDAGGSVPEQLLPDEVALLTPELLVGEAFVALPDLGVIVVVIDRNGDELRQPCVIPIEGGDPVPLFGDRFAGQQVELADVGQDGRGAIWVDPRSRPAQEAYRIDVRDARAELMSSSEYGTWPSGHNPDRSRYLIMDEYTLGDSTLWLWDQAVGERRLLSGTPLDQRAEGQQVPLNGFRHSWFVGDAALVETTRFDDLGGLGWLPLSDPERFEPVPVVDASSGGAAHRRGGETPDLAADGPRGELETVRQLTDDRFLIGYNVDGVSWGYEGVLRERHSSEPTHHPRLELTRVLWGEGELAQGVLQHHDYDRDSGRLAVAFSSATTPAQLATIEPDGTTRMVTRNRVLGLDPALLSAGEDASYQSHDGLRVSARLYLPSPQLGFDGKRPVVYYIHGGPQSQERPDFTWFSMPLIQYLTMQGFAVFVPNVRGSSGYGQAYTKHVDRDWGGQDRLDHVAAVARLREDPRVDADRIGVMGRSYGGYMTLTLIARHPELWRAAVDMFGPYDLPVWVTRLPESWQVYFRLAIGDPVTDREFLVERSPRTYMDALACPLLVIQGANDPRVTKADSDDLVAELRDAGKDVDYLVFDDEGHDLTRMSNKVRCYESIAAFFEKHL